MGLDPRLQDEPFSHRARALTGYAARVRTGYYSHGRQVRVGSVSSVIAAVGKETVMVHGLNLCKTSGSEKLIP